MPQLEAFRRERLNPRAQVVLLDAAWERKVALCIVFIETVHKTTVQNRTVRLSSFGNTSIRVSGSLSMTPDRFRPSSASLRPPGRRTFAVGLMLASWLSVQHASAESMDFALERLVTNGSTCRTSEGYSSGTEVCVPDNEAFINLINQYGMAIAPSAMYPARTTGYGGFEITVEGTYTTVNGDAEYMKKGTRGTPDPTTGRAASENASPASVLQLYSLRIRKGFGFGVETGLQFGVMPNTSIISGGADLRLAILEGFRDDIPGYLPDFAVMGSARTITGSSQVQLTVAGANAVFSKPFTLMDSAVLTPWIGYQHLFIFGDSAVIDFTPAESALQGCGFAGPNEPGTPGAEEPYDGSPVCSPIGTTGDFNNNRVFDPVRLQRQRLLFGANYRYEILTVGAQLMLDVFNQTKINKDEADALKGEPSNAAFSLQVGAQF